MKRPQLTTSFGLGGVTIALPKFIALFEGMKLNEVLDKFGSIPATAFMTSLAGLILSLWAIYHDESKHIDGKSK